MVEALAGNAANAIVQLEEAVKEADRTGDLFYRDCLRHNLGRALLDIGRADEAYQVASTSDCHHSGSDDLLVKAKRASLLSDALIAQGKNVPLEMTSQIELLKRSTKPQGWLYQLPWYYCDIEFWED